MARVGQFNLKSMRETSPTQKAKLGTLFEFPDGSLFRYALNGAGALTVGILVQSVVPTAEHAIEDCTTVEINSTTIGVILPASGGVVENQYQDGYIYTHTGTAEGYAYRIKSHPAALASTTVIVTLYEDNPIKVATVSLTTKVTLVTNPFKGVILHASPPTAEPVGWAPAAVAAGSYFWCQTKGPLAALQQGTLVIGDFCVPSATVDGAVMPSAAVETDGPPVGKVMSIGADGEYALIRGMLE